MMLHCWVGRPAEVDNDQIKTLIENNQCYTTQEIVDVLKNIQINKIIGENENSIIYFMEKTIQTFG